MIRINTEIRFDWKNGEVMTTFQNLTTESSYKSFIRNIINEHSFNYDDLNTYVLMNGFKTDDPYFADGLHTYHMTFEKTVEFSVMFATFGIEWLKSTLNIPSIESFDRAIAAGTKERKEHRKNAEQYTALLEMLWYLETARTKLLNL